MPHLADVRACCYDRSMPVDLKGRFTRNPKVCGGETVIAGTRVLLRTILASLADGDEVEAILTDFPSLTEDDMRAVIAFAAAAAEKDLPRRRAQRLAS